MDYKLVLLPVGSGYPVDDNAVLATLDQGGLNRLQVFLDEIKTSSSAHPSIDRMARWEDMLENYQVSEVIEELKAYQTRPGYYVEVMPRDLVKGEIYRIDPECRFEEKEIPGSLVKLVHIPDNTTYVEVERNIEDGTEIFSIHFMWLQKQVTAL